MNQEQHEMVLEINHSSGMQGWHCPTCGRRILLRVPPDSEMVVVDPGDRYASHSGSIGGLHIGLVSAAKQKLNEKLEVSLRPWIKALEDLNLNW